MNAPEGKVLEWEVSGDKMDAVHMLPGFTHNIINLSDTEDLVTVIYCNEVFNPERPDTFFEKVQVTQIARITQIFGFKFQGHKDNTEV